MAQWDPIKKTESNNYFCVAPWVHQYIGPPGDVKPCCVYEYTHSLGNLKDNTLAEIWNNEKTKQFRLDLLNGVKRPECTWCNDRSTPMKNSLNDFYFAKPEIKDIVAKTEQDGSVKEHKLFYMDVRFNNLCNFKCRSCGSHFSTSIAADEKAINPNLNVGFHYPGKTEDQAYEEMEPHFSNLLEVYFAGGEPMMQKEHYQTLEKLVEVGNTDCIIRYSTNFSKLKLGKWDVVPYWKNFKTVRVLASIDASYERGEYWRKGTIWSDIVKNRQRMLEECPNVCFMLSPTISWVNLLNWFDLHKEWTDLGYINVDDVVLNELITPSHLCMKNVPEWKKHTFAKAFDEHLEWMISKNASGWALVKLSAAKDFMLSEVNAKDSFPSGEFHAHMSRYDILRNEKFFDVFPEHLDMKDYMESQGYKF